MRARPATGRPCAFPGGQRRHRPPEVRTIAGVGREGREKPGVPVQGEVHAVGFAAVAGRAAGHVTPAETPTEGIARADRVSHETLLRAVLTGGVLIETAQTMPTCASRSTRTRSQLLGHTHAVSTNRPQRVDHVATLDDVAEPSEVNNE